jgi:acetyl esterase/lipase
MSSLDVSSVRVQVGKAIRELGRKFDPDVLQATYALYAPLQRSAPKGGVDVHKDLAYGDHERQRLDVFVPANKPVKAPIVIYFHGGGYVSGERSPLPGLIYDNVPTFFARHGMIGVNATYRLAPEYKWPSGGADVGKAIAWLRANADRYGGDPERIFLMGQSAGGTHVATWAFIPEVHGPKGPGIVGAILLSAVLAPYDSKYSPERPVAPHRLAYFGEDEAQWPAMNPINHISRGHPPVFISVTEFDPPPLQWSSPALVAALMRCDRAMPWFVYNRNHNHVSPAMQINLNFDDLGPQILEFVRSVG